MTTTNAMRILQAAKIPFSTREYAVDEQDLSGLHAAQQLGLAPELVFKTLVLRGQRQGIAVACIPVNCELDLKKFARCVGEKSMEMLKVSELLAVTGYVRGGCSPIGMKKHFPVYLDSSAQRHAQIYISAGRRGQQLLLAPADLQRVTNARFADLTTAAP